MEDKKAYLEALGDGLDSVSQPVEAPVAPLTDSEFIFLSTGVLLKVRRVAPRIILQVLEKFKPPKVPSVYDQEKERSIENPQDPAYIQASQDFLSERGFAMLDACIALGTEFYSLPDVGVPSLESEDWIDELNAAGIEFDTSRPRIRYTMWVKSVAAVSEEDLIAISRHVMRQSGVTKEDVASALESFRG